MEHIFAILIYNIEVQPIASCWEQMLFQARIRCLYVFAYGKRAALACELQFAS